MCSFSLDSYMCTIQSIDGGTNICNMFWENLEQFQQSFLNISTQK